MATALRSGYSEIKSNSKPWAIFLVIVLAIIAHWVWSVLIAGLPSKTFDFGPPPVWVARIVISFIAGAFSFVGISTNVREVRGPARYFATFAYGFAVDALTGPVIDAASGTGTAAS